MALSLVDIPNISANVKYKFKEKFEQEVMLYNECVIKTEQFLSWFKTCGIAMHQNECLKNILIPCLKAHHENDYYVFWLDKTLPYYVKRTLEILDLNYIQLVWNKYDLIHV